MSSSSLQQNESTILESVLKTYARPLRRFFLSRIRTKADVDDLVQDVFVRLVHRGSLSEVAHIQGYLFQTANSVLQDYLRRRVTRDADKHELHDENIADEGISPERVLIGKETVKQFSHALLELPERTRIIFVLSRLNGLDYRAIAKLQGISVSAVEKHMAKAMAHLVARVKV